MMSVIEAKYLPRQARYAPGAAFGPRVMTDHELVWILEGSAQWTLRWPTGQVDVHELRPGSVLVAPAGSTDAYRWDQAVSSSHGYVHFTWQDAPDRMLVRDALVRHAPDSRPVLALCDHLMALGTAPDADRSHADDVLALAVEILRRPVPPRSAPTSSTVLDAAFAHVRRRWALAPLAIIPLAELAAAAGVSRGHLSREFARRYRMGPSEALERVRLSRAAILLQRSNETIARIAVRHGYADGFHFSRRFHRVFGMPPSAFRRSGGDPLEALSAEGLLELWHLLE